MLLCATQHTPLHTPCATKALAWGARDVGYHASRHIAGTAVLPGRSPGQAENVRSLSDAGEAKTVGELGGPCLRGGSASMATGRSARARPLERVPRYRTAQPCLDFGGPRRKSDGIRTQNATGYRERVVCSYVEGGPDIGSGAVEELVQGIDACRRSRHTGHPRPKFQAQ